MAWLPTIEFDIWSWAVVLALLNVGCGSLGLLLLTQSRERKKQ